MEERFGREIGISKDKNFEFSVESYLDHQGNKFVDRFDANTYLKLTKALDRFDLVGKDGLDASLKDVSARVLVVAFTSDWLYTPAQNKLIVESLHRLGKEASYLEIDHKHGHDSFLIKSKAFLRSVRAFSRGSTKRRKRCRTPIAFVKLKIDTKLKRKRISRLSTIGFSLVKASWIWDAVAVSCSNTSGIPSGFEVWGWIMIGARPLPPSLAEWPFTKRTFGGPLKIWGINRLIGSYSHA